MKRTVIIFTVKGALTTTLASLLQKRNCQLIGKLAFYNLRLIHHVAWRKL